VESGTVPSFEESMPYANSYPEAVPKWLEQKYGYYLTMVSNLSANVPGTPYELKGATLPILPNAKSIGFPIATSLVMAVYAYGKYPLEAAKFVDYTINDEYAIRTNADTKGYPANKEAAQLLVTESILMPQMKSLVDSYNAAANKIHPNFTCVENSIITNAAILELCNEFAQEVGYKRMTPAQAATAFMGELEKLVEGLVSK
jgi:hypothetical protein